MSASMNRVSAENLLFKLPTYIFDEQSMQHDIRKTIILQGGEQ